MTTSEGRSARAGEAGRSFGKWLAISLGIAVGVALLIPKVWRGFNPLSTRKVDHSRPVLLHAITDLADLRAASAQLNVVVDVEEDAKWLPSVLRGERTVLLGEGHVDAGVDLSGLDERAIQVDEATNSVVVTLPHATLRKPELDLESTRVLVNKRGAFDRLGSLLGDAPTGEREALLLAQKKLEVAAKQSNVVQVAETNVTSTITGLMRGLGFDQVTVRFSDDPTLIRTPETVPAA